MRHDYCTPLPADLKKEAARKRAALRCAAALEKAADATQAFYSSALKCGEACELDDSRLRLIRDMREYQFWLESTHG